MGGQCIKLRALLDAYFDAVQTFTVAVKKVRSLARSKLTHAWDSCAEQKNPNKDAISSEIKSIRIPVMRSALLIQINRRSRKRVNQIILAGPRTTCEEKMRLLDEYVKSLKNWAHTISRHTSAVLRDDANADRLGAVVAHAGHEKDQAKFAYVLHVQGHGCGEPS